MRRIALACLLCAALTGCSGDLGDSLGPQTQYQFLHAVPDLQATTILVRETTLGTLNYIGNTNPLAVGIGSYPFRFTVLLPGDTLPSTLLDIDGTVEQNILYTYVLTGSAAAVDFTTWERELTVFTDDSILATQYGHAAAGFGPLDFYLEAPGANLPGAMPRASLSYQQSMPNVDVPPGDYVLTITPAGQAGTVLFKSATFTLAARTDVVFAVLSGADQGTAPLLVRVLGDIVGTLQDVNSPPGLRAANAVLNSGPVDVVVDDDFASPLISDVVFKEVTDPYAPSPVVGTEVPLDITPVADPGTSLVESNLVLENGVAYSLYYIGQPGTVSAVQLLDDNRQLADFAKLRIFEGGANYFAVDIYLVKPGDNYLSFFPNIAGLGFGKETGYLQVAPDVYDIIFTPQGVPTTVIAELRNRDLAATGVYSIMIVDTDDVNVADLVLYDDIPAIVP